jgi:hypothetical protein
MPIVVVDGGARVDVSPRIAENVNFRTDVPVRAVDQLFRPPPPTSVSAGTLQAVGANTLGNWFSVPDGAIYLTTPSTLNRDYTIHFQAPRGREGEEIILSPDEVRYTLARLVNFGRVSNTRNATVVANRHTIPFLVAYGSIRQEQVDEMMRRSPPPPDPSVGRVSAPQAVSRASTALIVVAIVGAAMYFLPRTGG